MSSRDPAHPSVIPSTKYASSYSSTYTHNPDILTSAEFELLSHVNCSYLSAVQPPTLLALKQHAHSLVNLIRKLSVTSETTALGDVGGEEERWDPDNENEAFDWLNDLDHPYKNDDESHHLPLWAVGNTIESESEESGLDYICPLKSVFEMSEDIPDDEVRRPYSTHANLTQHANECLERLDHEYSATGGLLSMLPTNPAVEPDQLTALRNTLLGQWLLHHQHLVARMHELEINHARALDLLAGEAVVPLQTLKEAGPEARSSGRQIAFPQDKYVLANAGDDVFGLLHRLMDRAEATLEQREKTWKASGVSGARMWRHDEAGELFARGLVPVDLVTRFYRIKDHGPGSPIFILPAVAEHPGLAATREMEARPGVVSVVTPTWPERVSDFEVKFRKRLDEATETEIMNSKLVRERIELEDMLAVKDAELRRSATQLKFFFENIDSSYEKREKSLLSVVSAHEKRLDLLRERLPQEYHRLLDMSVEEEDYDEEEMS